MKRASALVVGGGPCGIFAVGSLLKSRAFQHVTWCSDDSFQCGRLPIYSSVPANTRNDFLVDAFQALPSLNFNTCDERHVLQANPTSTSPLSTSLGALVHATHHLRQRDDVEDLSVRISQLQLGTDKKWRASSEDNASVGTFDSVVLCLGARPSRPAPSTISELNRLGIFLLDHDDAVSPNFFHGRQSRKKLVKGKKMIVVGASHSGCLAARNAVLHGGVESVDLLGLDPAGIRFAVERDEGDWIKYDGTGLKGKVAEWMREELAKEEGRCRIRYHCVEGGEEGVEGGGEESTLQKIVELSGEVVTWTTGFTAKESCDVSYTFCFDINILLLSFLSFTGGLTWCSHCWFLSFFFLPPVQHICCFFFFRFAEHGSFG